MTPEQLDRVRALAETLPLHIDDRNALRAVCEAAKRGPFVVEGFPRPLQLDYAFEEPAPCPK